MHDTKTLERSNSSQKARILFKKPGEIGKSSSYREKFIQGTDKFVRPTYRDVQVFEYPNYRDFFA